MSGKLRLAKTKDSRTRKQPVKAVNVAEAEKLKQELKSQQKFTEYLLLKGYSTNTTKCYVKDAEIFIQWAERENVPIESVSYSDVLHYIQGRRNNVKQRTISINVNSIKHYFNFLSLTHQKLENPTAQIQIKGIKRKILYHILSKQELESLYNNFKIPDENSKHKNQNWFKTSELASRRNKVILGLMIYQGLGSADLGRLTEKDLKLREGKLFVAGSRKSNERIMKLEAHQVLDIMEYKLKIRDEILALTGKQSEKLFVSTGQSDSFNNIIQKMIKQLNRGGKAISVKQIRTSVITHWLKIHNLRQVQYMAGHRYVSSTESYMINDLDDLQEDITKYHPIG